MSRKRYSAEQIISKLREAEVLIAKGQSIAQAAKDLERENTRLKKLVADLSLDKQILEEASRGNF